MIRASVIVRTPDECIRYSAIGNCTADIGSDAIEMFGICAFTVRAI